MRYSVPVAYLALGPAMSAMDDAGLRTADAPSLRFASGLHATDVKAQSSLLYNRHLIKSFLSSVSVPLL